MISKKIKRMLGICECNKCLRRSSVTLTIDALNKSYELCFKHMQELTEDCVVTGIKFRDIEE